MEWRGSQLPFLKLQLSPTIVLATNSQPPRISGREVQIYIIHANTCKCAFSNLTKGHVALGNQVLEMGT